MGQQLATWPYPASPSLLINGGFTIAQRGETVNVGANTAIYTLDRWRWDQNSDGGPGTSVSIAQVPFPLGQAEVPGNPRYYCRITNASVGTGGGNNSFSVLFQPIKGLHRFAGQWVTISLYARSSIPNKRFSIEALQGFGVGGSPFLTVGAKSFLLSSSFKRYVFTVLLPSLSGKTLGANSTDALLLILWLQAGPGFLARSGVPGGFEWGGVGTVDFANAKVEMGGAATPFQSQALADDLRQCLPYAWRVNNEPLGITRDGSNLYSWGKIAFPVPMRAAPTLLNGSLQVGSGLTGAPILFNATPYSTGLYNGAGNWSVGVGVTLSGLFEAEL